LKKIAFILLLFCCSSGWAQNFVIVDSTEVKSNPFSEEEYNKLLNHVPKTFVANQKSKPQNKVLAGDLNSISALELRFAYQEQLKLNISEIKWLEDEIDALAVAFFNERKPIILKRAGNYNDCNGRGIETELRNNFTVTILKFCYTCAGASKYEDRFLEVFNKRTEKLIAAKKQ
jgi:hypothetical protein